MFYCDTKRDIFSCFPKLCTISTHKPQTTTTTADWCEAEKELTMQLHSLCVSLLAWLTAAANKFPLLASPAITFADDVFCSPLMMTVVSGILTITRKLRELWRHLWERENKRSNLN